MYMFVHSITPIPLLTNNFHCQPWFLNQVIKSVNQSQRRQLNHSNNQTRQNRPNQLKTCVVVKSLWNWHTGVVEPVHDTSTQPQYQNQNSNQKETNVMVQINNTFHCLSLWILKQHLPRSWLISITNYETIQGQKQAQGKNNSNSTCIALYLKERSHEYINDINLYSKSK